MAGSKSGANGSSGLGGGVRITNTRGFVPKGSSTRGATPVAAQKAGGSPGAAVRGQSRTVAGKKGSNGQPNGTGKIKG